MQLIKAALKCNRADFVPEQWPHISRSQTLSIDLARHQAYCELFGFSCDNAIAPSYLSVASIPVITETLLDSSFPFALLGMVHVENQIEQYRAIELSEQLTARVKLGKLIPHNRGWLFEVVIDVANAEEIVWRSVMKNLIRLKVAHQGQPSEPFSNSDYLYTHSWLLDSALGRRYAAISGDYNPIHLYPATAKLLGFKRHIVHGMCSKAKCLATLMEQSAGGAILDAAAFSCRVKFVKPVQLPTKVLFMHSALVDKQIGFSLVNHGTQELHLLGQVFLIN